MIDKETELALIRELLRRRLDPFAPATLDDLKRFRLQLVQSSNSFSPEVSEKIKYLNNLIRYYDRPYIDPRKTNDLNHVQLSLGFTDTMFEYILPQICSVINQDQEWVTVFHEMIYDGWMSPVDFYVWVKWLNERLDAIGQKEVLPGSAARQICKYLHKPERYKWTLNEYQQAIGVSTKQSENKFFRLIELIDQVSDILFGNNTDDVLFGSGILSYLAPKPAS